MAAALRQTRAVLLDLSGTVHIGDVPTPGVVEAIEKLQRSSLKLRFVTNTTKESGRALLERLGGMGLNSVTPDQVYSSLSAARQLIVKRNLRPHLMIHSDALEDFAGIDTSHPNAIVVGLSPEHFNYEEMNKAFRLLMDGSKREGEERVSEKECERVELVAIHKARYYRREVGEGLSLGPGPFVEALEWAGSRKAVVVGKPAPPFFRGALEGMVEVDCPEEAVMVGDDWRDDVQGAMATGIRGVLVRTGKYRDGDETKSPHPPTLVCNDLSEAVDIILGSSQHA